MSGFGGTYLSHEEIQCRRMSMYVKRVDIHGEEIPMESKSEFGRPLPEGATVSKTGKVYLKGTPIVPCARCETGWKGVKSEQCGACWTRQAKAEGGPKAIKAKKAAVAVAATKTGAPHPQATPPQPGGTVATIGGQAEAKGHDRAASPTPPAPVHDGLVEELAQRYAEKIRARALQILGMGS